MATLILLNKPYAVLCQFTDTQQRRTLADYLQCPGFYPAGRLDYDSEGLVLLCNHGSLQQRIANPRHKLWKTYLLQLEGSIQEPALQRLREGVELKDGITRPARALAIDPPQLWPRHPPIRQRARQPTSWIQVQLREGKNRQLRRMCAAVGFPVLRLIRTGIGEWSIDDLAPGAHRQLTVHLPKAGSSQRPVSRKQTGKRPGAER